VSTANPQRRAVLKGGSLLTLLYSIDGIATLLSPREAHTKAVALQALSPVECRTLEAIGEVLLPGARSAGLAEYVDYQLSINFGDCLLAARVVDVAPPLAAFYRAALASIDAAAKRTMGSVFATLPAEAQIVFVKTMATSDPPGWDGPPAPLVFYLLRSDAIDVCYGTAEAYERLGVPYMPHLLPGTAW